MTRKAAVDALRLEFSGGKSEMPTLPNGIWAFWFGCAFCTLQPDDCGAEESQNSSKNSRNLKKKDGFDG